MAGVAGLEPAHHGIKTRCLTTWRHPSKKISIQFAHDPGRLNMVIIDFEAATREWSNLPFATLYVTVNSLCLLQQNC